MIVPTRHFLMRSDALPEAAREAWAKTIDEQVARYQKVLEAFDAECARIDFDPGLNAMGRDQARNRQRAQAAAALRSTYAGERHTLAAHADTARRVLSIVPLRPPLTASLDARHREIRDGLRRLAGQDDLVGRAAVQTHLEGRAKHGDIEALQAVALAPAGSFDDLVPPELLHGLYETVCRVTNPEAYAAVQAVESAAELHRTNAVTALSVVGSRLDDGEV
jgi:hypothetical protein